MKKVAIEIVKWLREQVAEAAADGIVVGLSGGVDSSLVAALSKEACPGKVLGLIMPCHSNPQDRTHAELAARTLGIPVKVVDLSPVYDAFLKVVGSDEGGGRDPSGARVLANLKPRLRMLTLYYHANLLNRLVAGTGNKSEAVMGYFTKYGDGGVDLLPIGNLLKTEVRVLARDLGIPEEIIVKPPSAGLWEGQTDEGEMGLTYEALDRAILAMEGPGHPPGVMEGPGSADLELVGKVRETMRRSEHKRRQPPTCPVSRESAPIFS